MFIIELLLKYKGDLPLKFIQIQIGRKKEQNEQNKKNNNIYYVVTNAIKHKNNICYGK